MSYSYVYLFRSHDIHIYFSLLHIDGYCPDISYTYMGRPPISPYLVTNYISKVVWKNCLLAGIDGFDLPSTVQHMFRSLSQRGEGGKRGGGRGSDKVGIRYRLGQLETMLLNNKIGIDCGGVSWQELKSRIYVPISSWRYIYIHTCTVIIDDHIHTMHICSTCSYIYHIIKSYMSHLHILYTILALMFYMHIPLYTCI